MRLNQEPLLFEKSDPGLIGIQPPENTFAVTADIPEKYKRKNSPPLPELSQPDVVRHYTRLSQKSFSVDTNFYPLGSCTMKYNPKINETLSNLEGFAKTHPLQSDTDLQGMLKALYECKTWLEDLTGLDACSLQPVAGAHGEFTSLLLIKAYYKKIGQPERNVILLPDTAHGTNPASATRAGFVCKQIASNEKGFVDLSALEKELNNNVAALMITNPNTLGLFEEEILKITELVHKNGSQIYMDGANFNAIIGITRPGDFGIDVMHMNLHKTFSTPHGGGGPGAGPIAVKKHLAPFLPVPEIKKVNDKYVFDYDRPDSIGKVRSFYGNLSVVMRAYIYMLSIGKEQFPNIAKYAVLNANYLLALLKDTFPVPYGTKCMHEFVASAKAIAKETGVKAIDIAKALIDNDIHPPTVYFPLIVEEAMMMEPTETESRETLEKFADILKDIAAKAKSETGLIKGTPRTTPISRPDELTAARKPILKI